MNCAAKRLWKVSIASSGPWAGCGARICLGLPRHAGGGVFFNNGLGISESRPESFSCCHIAYSCTHSSHQRWWESHQIWYPWSIMVNITW